MKSLVFEIKKMNLNDIGAAFNETIEEALLDVQIEDLWIPYFCITTDISASKMRVHTSGKIEKLFKNLFLQEKRRMLLPRHTNRYENSHTFLQEVFGVMYVHQ